MVEIVNVVSSGSLDLEIDLESLSKEIGSIADYNPEKYPGMYLRFEEDIPLITVYRTGKYIITGADSEEESYTVRERFLDLLSDIEVIEHPDDDWFLIQNYVCTAEFDQSLNLNALTIGLGLERTEYEPEQFPGLIYRPSSGLGVVLIFATGRVVITGCRSIQDAKEVFSELRKTLSEFIEFG